MNNNYGGYGGFNSNTSGGYGGFNSGMNNNNSNAAGGYGGYGSGGMMGGNTNSFHNDNNSPFGGNAGGVGGFLPSNNPFGSPSTNSPGGGKGKAHSLRSFTIKQLLDAEAPVADNPLKIDGFDVHNIKLVGKLCAVNTQSTNVTYSIDDGTGVMDCKKFLDNNEESEMETISYPQFTEGQYVTIFGNLKMFGGQKRNLNVFTVRPVNSLNEITFHQLQVMAQHLTLQKGLHTGMTKSQPSGLTGTAQGLPSFPGSIAPPSYGNNAPSNLGAYGAQQSNSQPSFGLSDFSPLQRQILNFMRSQAPNDVRMNTMIHHCRGSAPENEIRHAMEFLCTEGHLFNTVDDDTYSMAS